jgi:hypothetical protein
VKPEEVDRATRGLSQKVRAICQKALARDPAERFATGHEMAQALLAEHEYRGPSAVRDEIAALEALPDMSHDDVRKLAARLRWVMRTRRALVPVGLALVALTAVFVWSPSRSAPPGPAAQGTSTANEQMNAGSAQGHDVVVTPPSDPAPGKLSALPGIVANKKARAAPTVIAPPPAEMHVSLDADESMSNLEASYVKVSGEALSPPHALAALFVTGNADLTQFRQASRRHLTVNGLDVFSTVWMNDDSGTVAVVVDLPNPNDAPPWEPLEGRIIISHVRSSSESPVALRAMPRVIPPGRRGRVAVVFNRSVIEDKAMVEILRGSRPDFGIEVSSRDLEQRNSLWRSLWPFGER